jgi:hypothetical protein
MSSSISASSVIARRIKESALVRYSIVSAAKTMITAVMEAAALSSHWSRSTRARQSCFLSSQNEAIHIGCVCRMLRQCSIGDVRGSVGDRRLVHTFRIVIRANRPVLFTAEPASRAAIACKSGASARMGGCDPICDFSGIHDRARPATRVLACLATKRLRKRRSWITAKPDPLQTAIYPAQRAPAKLASQRRKLPLTFAFASGVSLTAACSSPGRRLRMAKATREAHRDLKTRLGGRCRQPAVDDQFRPRHIRRFVRCQHRARPARRALNR